MFFRIWEIINGHTGNMSKLNTCAPSSVPSPLLAVTKFSEARMSGSAMSIPSTWPWLTGNATYHSAENVKLSSTGKIFVGNI